MFVWYEVIQSPTAVYDAVYISLKSEYKIFRKKKENKTNTKQLDPESIYLSGGSKQ